MDKWMNENISREFSCNRAQAMNLLQEEQGLLEIVRLVGRDSLSELDQLKLEATKSIREDYLQQNAFHDVDTFCSLQKQDKMLKMVLEFYEQGKRGLDNGVYLKEIEHMSVRERITRAKYIPEDNISEIDEITQEIKTSMDKLISKGGILNA
jgi:V/A-type H+-transporting ATPase subunit A